MNSDFFKLLECTLRIDFGKNIEEADSRELYFSIGKAFNAYCSEKNIKNDEKRACYFSAEFLLGKLTRSNLFNIGLLDETQEYLSERGRSLDELEQFDDLAMGNGGLGRLAACFLDSAASENIPLDGFGLRYTYGYFKQDIIENKQKESAEKNIDLYDSFGIRRSELSSEVRTEGKRYIAVPYEYYIPGYKNGRLNKLVLFQCESEKEMDFELFDRGEYDEAFREKTEAMTLTACLYPNDNTQKGKELRLRQQYFLVSASLQYLIKQYLNSGKSLDKIENSLVIQLNDTHPTLAIPEFIRLIMNTGVDFNFAFNKAKRIFAYTNHTVLSEALEKWSVKTVKKLIPEIYDIILKIDERAKSEVKKDNKEKYSICDGEYIHMASLACYMSFSVNGVAEIHSDIIKKETLSPWYSVFPEKFNNKTNGVTQRRWLYLSNPELYRLLKELTKGEIDDDFGKISILKDFRDDKEILDRLYNIKQNNKKALSEIIFEREHIRTDPDSVFCVQIKRLHEYKRQLMNVLSVIYFYQKLLDGDTQMPPVTFIIGAKAAPGYSAAKRIIELINSVAEKINKDEKISGKLKLVYANNYNVSYAEKIIPGADISEQISLAGKEASGTGNMKLMMNGAVTLGTYDGANIEIVREAGEENNYIFGLRENEVAELSEKYDPLDEYEKNATVKRITDTLTDFTFTDCEGNSFEDIFTNLIDEDKYFVLKDLPSYIEAKIKAIRDCTDKYAFTKKSLMNIASCSFFSSDRTVKEYAEEIWFKESEEGQ